MANGVDVDEIIAQDIFTLVATEFGLQPKTRQFDTQVLNPHDEMWDFEVESQNVTRLFVMRSPGSSLM